MGWPVFLFVAFLGALLLACGGNDEEAGTSSDIPYQLPGAGPPRAEAELYTEDSVWADSQAQARIHDTCFESGLRDEGSRRFCVEQLMLGYDAPMDAIEFFLASGRWMVGLVDGEHVRAALLLAPEDGQGLPFLAFLHEDAGIQNFAQLFADAYPRSAETDAWPFEDDALYPALFRLAQETFRGADDPLDLRHFDMAEVENAETLPGARKRYTVQLGIHNFCLFCGVGIAARYELDFNAGGRVERFDYIDMCQGEEVTEEVEGLGEITYHRFSGVQASAQTGVFSEPYLLVLPELDPCPSPMRLID